MYSGLLKQGKNYWQLAQADRAAPIIDGADYFRAFREACLKAKRHIYVLAWDIQSQLQLLRHRPGDDAPNQLSELLDYMAREHGVKVYVLAWDFAMIYALEREWLPVYRMHWRTHRRFRFQLDDAHPVAGSQHQKVVVVDDQVAFSGGLDLTKCRWDTPAHRPDDPGRVDADGEPYPPFHDVQMVVAGEAAGFLGDLCRERWQRATGHKLSAPRRPVNNDPWPTSITPIFNHTNISISLTQPEYEDCEPRDQVQQLYLDSIAGAERWIYIENQYLTSHTVTNALAQSLRQRHGPEVVLVLPKQTGGWLEQNTMDVLRWRALKKLRSEDLHNRLRVYYPDYPKLGEQSIMVHAKVMIADGEWLRIGSANLSNRSMRLDTECDLSVLAESNEEKAQIRGMLSRLLAEHMNCDPETIEHELEQRGSLIQTIEHLSHEGRCLKHLRGEVDKSVERLLPESALVDPEQPVTSESVLQHFVEQDEQVPVRRRLLYMGVLFLGLLALAIIWRWSPLGDYLDVETLQSAGAWLTNSWLGIPITLMVYLIGGLIAFPVTLLITVTLILFGPWLGFTLSLVGSVASAALAYGVGRALGRHTVRNIAGRRINRVSQKLARQGLLSIVFVRIVPVAPFTVINLIAGASHISFAQFVAGTLLGMAPGILGLTFMAEPLLEFLHDPDWGNLALLAGAVLVVVAIIALFRSWVQHKQSP